jgi:CBS-domain-containing membrane protein
MQARRVYFYFRGHAKKLSLRARPVEHLLEILMLFFGLLAASVVHSPILTDCTADAALINAPLGISGME